MGYKKIIPKLSDGLMVGFSRETPTSDPVMVVGRKKLDNTIVVINAFQGDEARELYEKLTTLKKGNDE